MNFSKALIRAELFAKNPKYVELAANIKEATKRNDELAVDNLINMLPTDEELFEKLIKAIEGKSVHTGILKLVEGKTHNKYEVIKVYSSLLTHCSIHCESEPEYEILFEGILSKIYDSLSQE